MKTNKFSLVCFLLSLALAPDAFGQKDQDDVKQVLLTYKTALEKLDLRDTQALFASASKIIESGSDEGTYTHYLEHHLGPEFSEFKSFTFENYKIQVTVLGTSAIAVETYDFVIVPKGEGANVRRKGVASSFLEKQQGRWKIVHMHSSSRKP